MLRLLAKRPAATRAFPKVVRSLATEATSTTETSNLNEVCNFNHQIYLINVIVNHFSLELKVILSYCTFSHIYI